jgi:hypothetical protein
MRIVRKVREITSLFIAKPARAREAFLMGDRNSRTSCTSRTSADAAGQRLCARSSCRKTTWHRDRQRHDEASIVSTARAVNAPTADLHGDTAMMIGCPKMVTGDWPGSFSTREGGSGGARPPGVSSASIFLGAYKRNFCGYCFRRSAQRLNPV